MNWEKGRFYVTSSKTEHHQGKEGRQVPIFPELKTELETLWLRTKGKDKEFVVNLYRDSQRSNLGKPFAQIVKDAEIEPIQKPFNNMWASRSTEIYDEHGAFLESQWIGHSTKVAQAHYLQVRDEDFEKAVGKNHCNENKISHQISRQHKTAKSCNVPQARKMKNS